MTDALHIRYEGPDIRLAISTVDWLRVRMRFAKRGPSGLISIPKWENFLRSYIPFRKPDPMEIMLSGQGVTMIDANTSVVATKIHGNFLEYANNDPTEFRAFLRRLSNALKTLSAMPSPVDSTSALVRRTEQIASIDTLDPDLMAAFRSSPSQSLTALRDTLYLSLPYPFHDHTYEEDIELLSCDVRSEIGDLPQAVFLHHDVTPDKINYLTISSIDVTVSPPDDPVERMRLIAEVERRSTQRSTTATPPTDRPYGRSQPG